MKSNLLAGLIHVFCTLCLAQNPAARTSSEEVVVAKHGAGFLFSSNPEGSFHLYTRERLDSVNNLPTTSYVIVRSHDKKIVEEGSITLGQLQWVGNYLLQIQPMQGQVRLNREGNQSIRSIDLRKYLNGIIPP